MKCNNIKGFSINNKKYKNTKPNLNIRLNTSGSHSKKKNINNLKTNFIRGKSFIENKIFGENFNLSKRINEKNSVYSVSQWKKDFKKSRVYKKISCEYPSINFVKKPKRIFKNNYAFSPAHNANIFSEVRFKPFESFEEEKSKVNSLTKKRRRKRKFNFSKKN